MDHAALLSPPDWRHGLIALILFRLFDITKPFPVRRLETAYPKAGASSSTTSQPGCMLWVWRRCFAFGFTEVRRAPNPPPNPHPKRRLQMPRIDEVVPPASLPQGEVELTGGNLGPHSNGFGRPWSSSEAIRPWF